MYLAHRMITAEYQSAGSYLNHVVLWRTNERRRTLAPFQLLQLNHFAIKIGTIQVSSFSSNDLK